MRAAIARFFAFLIGTALTVLIVLDMVRPQNPWTGRIKGEALRLLWDRQSPLECGSNAVMVVRDDSFERERGPVFEASGRCRLSLIGVRARAPRVLSVTGDAHVVLEGGRLEGKESVIDASGGVVQVRGTTLVGPVKKAGEARIEGLPGEAPPSPPPAAEGAPGGERKPAEKAPPKAGKRKGPRRPKG